MSGIDSIINIDGKEVDLSRVDSTCKEWEWLTSKEKALSKKTRGNRIRREMYHEGKEPTICSCGLVFECNLQQYAIANMGTTKTPLCKRCGIKARRNRYESMEGVTELFKRLRKHAYENKLHYQKGGTKIKYD